MFKAAATPEETGLHAFSSDNETAYKAANYRWIRTVTAVLCGTTAPLWWTANIYRE